MFGRGVGLVQAQIDALDGRVSIARIEEQVAALDRLMTAKFVTLETLMQYQAEKVALALNASQTAIDKSDIADEKARDRLAEDLSNRFESVNEFRSQQRDMIAGFMPRLEFEQFRQMYTEQHSLLRDRYAEEISDLKTRLDRAEGRGAGISSLFGYLVAAITVVVIVVNVVLYALSK